MLLAFLLLASAVLVAVAAAYRWHIQRHLPHDLRKVQTEGLPSDASIRSGELGRGAASGYFRNLGPF